MTDVKFDNRLIGLLIFLLFLLLSILVAIFINSLLHLNTALLHIQQMGLPSENTVEDIDDSGAKVHDAGFAHGHSEQVLNGTNQDNFL